MRIDPTSTPTTTIPVRQKKARKEARHAWKKITRQQGDPESKVLRSELTIGAPATKYGACILIKNEPIN